MPDAPVNRYTRQLPSSLQQILEDVMACAARGDWEHAHASALRLHSAAPDSVPIALLAAQVMLQVDRYRDARALVLRTASLPIDAPDLLLQTVGMLRRFDESEVLEALVQGSDWRKCRSLPLLAELAQHLGFSGLYLLAFDCLKHMLDIEPQYADAHYLRGLFEMFSGDLAVSEVSVRRALTIEPRMANAHWLLSMQDDAQSAGSHVADMLRVLPASASGSEARAYFDYSLHYSLNALGRHDEAWEALARGHSAMRRLKRYRRGEQHSLVSALERMALPAFDPEPVADGQTGLIFIVGMFRSGTTLIERVLAGHPEVVDGGETYQLSACLREATDHDCNETVDATIVARAPSADFSRIRQRMLAYATWRAQGRRWLTEKLPSNFLNLGFILHAFPDAHILHMRRDPVETCFSNLRTIFRGAAPYACDQHDLADYYLLYRRMMAHWHALAPGRILDVDYAAFVDDPTAHAKRIMMHCGLDYVPEALNLGRQGGATATASAAHVRTGILNNRREVWRPYEQQLQPMIQILRAAYEAESSS